MIRKEVLFLLFFIFCYLSLNSQTDSIAYYKEQVTHIRNSPNFTPRDTTYIQLLNILSSKIKYRNTDSLSILSIEALSLSEDINYTKGKNDALSYLAIYELVNGNYEKSLNYNLEILKNIDKSKRPELAAGIYNIMGQTYSSLSNYPEAYKHLYESLLLAQLAGNNDLIIKINSNLGTLFSLLEDYNEATKYYQVALEKINKDDNTILKAGIQCNLGYLFMKKRDSTKALDFLRKSLPTLEKQNATLILGITYTTFGDVYYTFGDFKKSLRYFKKALPYYEFLNDARNKAAVLYGVGTSYLALNNFEKAEEFLKESVFLYKKVQYKIGLEQSYRALYKLNNSKAKAAKALYFLELSQSYSDSIFKEKSVRDIAMLKAKMAFEEDKADIILKNNIEVAEQKKYVRSAIFGFICALIIALLVFQANRTERKLNNELAIQTHSLTQKQEELNEINKNQDKLFSIVGHDLRGPIVSLKQLLTLALENETGVQHFYRFGPKLKKDVDHIHFTLDNLLNWGLTQMQGEPLNPIAVNIQKELSEIIVLFREVLDKKSITIHKDFLTSKSIFVDANHFKIIFRNLISNAIKFTPEHGDIWLKSRIEENNLIISIQDNGIGMTKDVLRRIFNQSEYYTTFGTDNERGTGLGLALCKEMVVKNNGTISVTSIPDEGSTFYVKFPRLNHV